MGSASHGGWPSANDREPRFDAAYERMKTTGGKAVRRLVRDAWQPRVGISSGLDARLTKFVEKLLCFGAEVGIGAAGGFGQVGAG